MKIALGLSYTGTGFFGWQKQNGFRTIEAVVEQAVSSVAGEPVRVYCAGRTDAGVHAISQVIHFTTSAYRSEIAWVFGVNHYLPNTVRVLWSKAVSEDFHARFSAVARHYHYLLYNHSVRSALVDGLTTWYPQALDSEAMQRAGRCLVGEHDFSAFRGADCQAKHATRFISQLTIQRYGALISIEISANAFLLHMVRNIVGSLVLVGAAKQPECWLQEVLLAQDRKKAGMTMPSRGLYLAAVSYPAYFGLPEAAPRIPFHDFFFPTGVC
eukprot:TRINITY_DN13476_c0_g3_i1.p1 TRINITY_DN13476_c0_g3~~TRINITY_DN13476_c0_g3_i1.p1  ORF type:complete len:269 (+),score=-59.67 TRINITY_DN13476_c0_g3_i1:991-1797(+)